MTCFPSTEELGSLVSGSNDATSKNETTVRLRQKRELETQIKVKCVQHFSLAFVFQHVAASLGAFVCRSTQLNELQNRVVEADQGNVDKTKRPMFDDMRSMTEYRIGINYLVDKVATDSMLIRWCLVLVILYVYFIVGCALVSQVKKSRVAHLKQQKVNNDLTQEIEELQKQLEVGARCS